MSCEKSAHYDLSDKRDWQVGRIGVREGLTNSRITDIEQDGDGLIWVGTEGGLYHLTGDRCRHYDARQMGLQGSNVSSLCYDSINNMVWIATLQTGLTRYNCKTREFSVLTKDSGLLSDMIASVTIAADGGVWIFHHRGQIQHWKADTIQTLLTKGLSDVIRSGLDDGKGHLFVGHRNQGVSCIDIKTLEITENVPMKCFSGGTTPCKNIYTLQIDSLGQLWGGYRSSTWLIDRDGNEWQGVTGRGLEVRYHKQPFFRVNRIKPDDRENQRIASCIAQDEKGYVWVGTENALLCCDREGQLLETIDLLKPLGIDRVYIYSLYCDGKGGLLLGLDDNGIVSYNSDTKEFVQYGLSKRGIDVYDFCKDIKGKLWVATEMGIFMYKNSGQFEQDKQRTHQLYSQNVHSIDVDARGNMWVGTVGDGVMIFTPDGSVMQRLRTFDGLRSDNVTQILCDKQTGEVWIATNDGLVHIFDSTRPNDFEILDQQQGVADNRIESLVRDVYGQMWLSTPIGVSAWDADNHRFINYNYQDGIPEGHYIEASVLCLDDGQICFGSYAGIAIVTPETNGHSRRVPVETFSFRLPLSWWLSIPMVCVYVFIFIFITFKIVKRNTGRIRTEAIQTERVLQQMAPVSTELSIQDKYFLDKLSAYIEANLQGDNLDVVSLAQEMAMSHSVFYRRIKSLTGCTASEFIRKIKLRRSRQLLEEGGRTVQEVAYMTGFKNVGNFRQAFKKEFGLLPSEILSN